MMRAILYILGFIVVGAIITVLIAGRRGEISRNRPMQIFPDMKRQLKLRPQTANSFFADGLSSQLAQPGTIAQEQPLLVNGKEVYSFDDVPVNTGHLPGSTNFVELNPFPITGEFLARGQRQFTIYCSPCHGQTGLGDGITKKIGAMAVVANLHDKRIVEMPDGELYTIVKNGKNLMGGYGPQIPVEDRWAVIAYLRALQLSRLGSVDDLSPETRAKLK
jgi:hypothetical protein